MKTVLSLLLVLAGCLTGDDNTVPSTPPSLPPPTGGGGGGSGGGGGGGGGGGNSGWLTFDSPTPLGIGLEYDLSYRSDSSVYFDTSDPLIATAVKISNEKRVRLVGKAAGIVELRAWKAGTTPPIPLNTVALHVVPVESVAVRFRNVPAVDPPVAALAALANSTDSLGIAYRDGDDAVLRGRGGVVTATGAITLATMTDDNRLTDLFSSSRVLVAAGPAGTGALVVSVEGVAHEVPIEIVPAASSYDIALTMLDGLTFVEPPPVIEVGSFVFADVIGYTADGRYVAGVRATWTGMSVSGSAGATVGSEASFTPQNPGAYALAASVGTASVSRDLVFVPAAP